MCGGLVQIGPDSGPDPPPASRITVVCTRFRGITVPGPLALVGTDDVVRRQRQLQRRLPIARPAYTGRAYRAHRAPRIEEPHHGQGTEEQQGKEEVAAIDAEGEEGCEEGQEGREVVERPPHAPRGVMPAGPARAGASRPVRAVRAITRPPG